MSKFPPKNQKDIVKLLFKLGFLQKTRIGRKRHPFKFEHPNRNPNREKFPNQPPFIIVPHKVNHNQIRYILKELKTWGYSEDDFRDAFS